MEATSDSSGIESGSKRPSSACGSGASASTALPSARSESTATASARPASASTIAAKAALAELSQKVVQLTKVTVFLHTRCDGHEARCAALRASCEDEVRQVSSAAASCVEAQRRHTAEAAAKREEVFARLEAAHKRNQERAVEECAEMRDLAESRHAAIAEATSRAEEERAAEVASVRLRAERLRSELVAAESQARGDRRWLARQLAAEAARERQAMDEAFEQECARLRGSHVLETEAIKAARETSLSQLHVEHDEGRAAAGIQAERELTAALGNQELGFEAERSGLESRASAARDSLAQARSESASAREACEELQRQLDAMSRELQERKKRGRELGQEADRAHSRKLKAEADARALRRQKATIERSLNGGATGAPQTERALIGLAEDVRAARAKADNLSGEVERSHRLLEQRESAVAQGVKRSELLTQELAEERCRSDELQRMLLRLEQGA